MVLWGLMITYSIPLKFPFLTIITILALFMRVRNHVKSDLAFFVSACLWIIFSAETIGFIMIYDPDNYERMIIAFIPLLLSSLLMFSVKNEYRFINRHYKKLFLIPLLIIFGIGSYIYKPMTEEINCWYYFDNDNSYNVLFAKSPGRTFEVELISNELKEEVKKDALQYKGRNGYYCPETKVRIVTSFGEIISAEIIAFRNSKLNKEVTFRNPTIIPIEKVKGELEILNPITLRLWN